MEGMKNAIEAELGLDESSAVRDTRSRYSDTNQGLTCHYGKSGEEPY